MHGKLPFQVKRNSLTTAEQIRKQLISEISGGIAHKQKRLLMSTSSCNNTKLILIKTLNIKTFFFFVPLVFCNLIMKMLEPNPRKRFTISQVKISSWIYSNAINEFYEPNEEWLKEVFLLKFDDNLLIPKYLKILNLNLIICKKTIKKIAAEFSLTMADVQSYLNDFPYHSVSGIFNIKKHSWQMYNFTVSQNIIKMSRNGVNYTIKSLLVNAFVYNEFNF